MSTAVISADGRYRYHLSRTWGSGPSALFVMLNPSTADAEVDDPTIRRCIGFAKSWGMGGLMVVNLYGLRATNPRALWSVDTAQAIGPDNDDWIRYAAGLANDEGAPIVAAWGANAKPARVAWVREMPALARLSHLGLTNGGAPRHPLYLRADSSLAAWA